MPIPPFDHRGLLPEGIYNATLQEIARTFCINDWRADLWVGFNAFLQDYTIPQSINFPLYLAGSFISDKLMPSDIEVTLELNSSNIPLPGVSELLLCGTEQSHLVIKERYKVDFYLYHKEMANNFCLFFQYVGDKTAQIKGIDAKDKRGIIRVIYDVG